MSRRTLGARDSGTRDEGGARPLPLAFAVASLPLAAELAPPFFVAGLASSEFSRDKSARQQDMAAHHMRHRLQGAMKNAQRKMPRRLDEDMVTRIRVARTVIVGGQNVRREPLLAGRGLLDEPVGLLVGRHPLCALRAAPSPRAR